MSNQELEQRKFEHIVLAGDSQCESSKLDERFYYEPLLSAHPQSSAPVKREFLGKTMNFPLWISSMTGGTGKASIINKNLANATKEFGLGLGLGSCRPLLESNEFFNDFNLRPILGDDAPFLMNLGIAQLEELVSVNKEQRVVQLVSDLQCDGLIIHINPLQEWFQPEGDRYTKAPIETIKFFRDLLDCKIVVKEVGQGMGPSSLHALIETGVDAIEFGAFGGTNFSRLEALRSKDASSHLPLQLVGHTAKEMVEMVNKVAVSKTQFIISGGVKGYLDGYYLTSLCQHDCVYGQAYSVLKHADEDYEKLHKFMQSQIAGFNMAQSYLKLR